MNEDTKHFLEELKQKPGVLGVILFGSWARGNSRPESDVDLVVILEEGYRRTVEYRDQQAFEIIYTTEEAALEYWRNHRDDAAGLWEVAEILYDKDGTIQRLKSRTTEVLSAGKKPIDDFQLGQYLFDAEDQLRYVETICASDPTTANMILTLKVHALTELFFDIRQMWIPAPKQRLAKIREIDPDFYAALLQFYLEHIAFKEKLAIAKRIVSLVLKR
jgi:predicted nucleotidyltransferase